MGSGGSFRFFLLLFLHSRADYIVHSVLMFFNVLTYVCIIWFIRFISLTIVIFVCSLFISFMFIFVYSALSVLIYRFICVYICFMYVYICVLRFITFYNLLCSLL